MEVVLLGSPNADRLEVLALTTTLRQPRFDKPVHRYKHEYVLCRQRSRSRNTEFRLAEPVERWRRQQGRDELIPIVAVVLRDIAIRAGPDDNREKHRFVVLRARGDASGVRRANHDDDRR